MITSHCTQTYEEIRSMNMALWVIWETSGAGSFLQRGQEQYVKTHLVPGSLPFPSSVFLSLPPLCVRVCANHRAPDPNLEGSTEKHIHSHEKIAVAAATAAWRNAGQNKHGSRAQRPETPEERIQGGCICMRTEGELRRNALGRGLVMKDKCDIVLICMLAAHQECVWDLEKQNAKNQNQVFPVADSLQKFLLR
jgi:hypothetical protein